ncbi:MAG: hypothetical protein JST00_01665 [Deltaproteobacteria bacterium]|nr:hypothetical protein [Deltaproteobacteria bacterium]
MNFATLLSLTAFVLGVLFAGTTWSLASAPNTRGLRELSLACLCGALYGASNAMLTSDSFELSRWGIRTGLLCIGGHGASWFLYTAQREGRSLTRWERVFVVGSIVVGLITLVPNAFYRSDEVWVHEVPALGVRYTDARSTPLGNLAFVFLGCGVALLLRNAVRRHRRSGDRMAFAEVIGLGALGIAGLNDSLVTAGVLRSIYLLDLAYVALVIAVGSSLARRFVEDANDLVAAQAELVQRERLAAIGEMSAVVAHEVRNPVAIVLNAATSMRKRPEDREELLRIIEDEAGRLTRMVTDLLDFARPSKLQLDEERFVTIVESALDTVRRASPDTELDVDVVVPVDMPSLQCDVRLIRQAIVNLVTNALQAAGRNGPVLVSASLVDDADQVRITVSDDGEGVSPDIRDRIFRPFFTTRATGTGLGLAVVRRFVEAHGGTLTQHDTPGGGATFEVRLPLRAKPPFADMTMAGDS